MQVSFESIQVAKRVPLTISRGTVGSSTIFWLRIEAEGVEGWGEASPFSIGSHEQSAETITAELNQLCQHLTQFHPLQGQAIETHLQTTGVVSAVR
ncbi:dipeptide epimerase, partial [filamentous cyanobacterium CCP5]